MIIDLETLASLILFGQIKNKAELEDRIKGQWIFRKNKDIEDVRNAIRKGLKLGAGRTEREIDCVALYLKYVFKKDRRNVRKGDI